VLQFQPLAASGGNAFGYSARFLAVASAIRSPDFKACAKAARDFKQPHLPRKLQSRPIFQVFTLEWFCGTLTSRRQRPLRQPPRHRRDQRMAAAHGIKAA